MKHALLTLTGTLLFMSTSVGQTFPEDFEGQTSFWYAAAGVWQVGTPTNVGPPTAHGGTKCAGTVIDGNYSDSSPDARLTPFTTVLVPPANESPRLRFWHWFSMAENDFGRVQISADDGVTWADLTAYTYANTSSAVWSVEELDLSHYGGLDVKIGFFFHAHTTGLEEVSSGWYVDDLEIRALPFVFINPENFEEEDEGDWAVDRGSWEIGVPAAGPGSGHLSPSCAGTALNSNYHDGIDTRLRSTWFTVPEMSENPRVRFWQWFSCAENDRGSVQISADDSIWTPLTDYYYANTSSDVWSVEEIDLSHWAGQTVKLAFLFHSHTTGLSETSSGWYIDDMEIRTGSFVFNDPEGFEQGVGDWSVHRGTWEIGVPEAGPTSGHLSSTCASTALSGNYHDGVDSRLRSPWFEVPGADAIPRLRFWQWFSCAENDYGIVQISTDDSTWTALTSYVYSNTSSGVWSVEEIDLTPWAGETVKLAFMFHSHTTGLAETSSGWYVDDLEIRTGWYLSHDPESFEDGEGDWSVDRGTWEIGEPTSGPLEAYSGSKCAATVLGGNYHDGVDTRLRSTWLVLDADSNPSPYMTFMQWFSFAENDYGRVQIQTANSDQWVDLSDPIAGTSTEWSVYFVDLNAYLDSTFRLGFYFHSHTTGLAEVSSGWYIDSLDIEELNVGMAGDIIIKQAVFAWPNPFSSNLTINIPSGNEVDVLVHDPMGRSVRAFNRVQAPTINWNGRTTSGTEVPPGMYLVTVIADGQRYTQRVIKQ